MTVKALRDVLLQDRELYDRNGPVQLTRDAQSGTYKARLLTQDALVMLTHEISRPVNTEGNPVPLPISVARLYLNWAGKWQLRPLTGITTAPILREDGSILSGDGYDEDTGFWQYDVPDIEVPERPSREDAGTAFRFIREMFKTFPFADAIMVPGETVPVVDMLSPPGQDETAFLHAFLTGVVRSSVHLAPGIIITAAPLSGAGSGKGLLARSISMVAFGYEPSAITGGKTSDEFEKRVATELLSGDPVIFLDNLNNLSLRSDQLASAITERRARIRILGQSRSEEVNSSALIILAGNGLDVTEDLARRFLFINLDPRTEDPEARPFQGDLLAQVKEKRSELLRAALTIWRWGVIEMPYTAMRPIGSFEKWSAWVRRPLMALGCGDVAERIREAKANDTRRQDFAAAFDAWFDEFGSRPVPEAQLSCEIQRRLDPQDRGRQYRASLLAKMENSRVGGYLLTRQAPVGRNGVATYAVIRIDERPAEASEHPGHRGHPDTDDEPKAWSATV